MTEPKFRKGRVDSIRLHTVCLLLRIWTHDRVCICGNHLSKVLDAVNSYDDHLAIAEKAGELATSIESAFVDSAESRGWTQATIFRGDSTHQKATELLRLLKGE